MGEWYTFLILAFGDDPSSRIDEDIASEAAAGWAGDTYLVYFNPANGETGMVLALQWETNNDAVQSFEAFQDYGVERFGTPEDQESDHSTWMTTSGYNAIYKDGLRTVWISAPDSVSGTAIWEALNSP
jgi:hypothetical protein